MPFYVLRSSLCLSTGSSVSNRRLHLLNVLPHYTFSLLSTNCLEIRLVIEAYIQSGGVTRGGISFHDFASKNIRYTLLSFFFFLCLGDDYIYFIRASESSP
ncbi:hypothetical protein CXB51_031897 [Gossypium anomalum]|uniref:Uncharacterized protein n=1 Tax=Gossypium anomalum TaxID=47600 RepID=A0A8J6CLM8_9ROSI|nr:hypothetical protein CXB51_031897 [Gossypium anomalum]